MRIMKIIKMLTYEMKRLKIVVFRETPLSESLPKKKKQFFGNKICPRGTFCLHLEFIGNESDLTQWRHHSEF